MSGKVVDINRRRKRSAAHTAQPRKTRAAAKAQHPHKANAAGQSDAQVRRQNAAAQTQHRRQTGAAGQSVYSTGSSNAVASKAATPKAIAQNKVQLQDFSLLMIVFFLLAFGLVMLYSVSSYEAGVEFGDPAYYAKRQAIFGLGGLIGMLIVARIDYLQLTKVAWVAYWGTLIAVIAVYFVGTEVNGAKRWLRFGPISVQPAEFSKIAIILLTAFLACQISPKGLRTPKGLCVVLGPALVQFVAIWRANNNMSTGLIVLLIAIGIYFIAMKEYLVFFLLGGGGLAAFIGYSMYLKSTMSSATNMGFRSTRILAWLDPSKYAGGTGFQTLQGLYGIGSGGIFGKGLGESMQKLGYIPEAQNDMIFSIICEELGLFGAISIMVLFVILCWRFMVVAMNANDMFGGLVAAGVMTHIAVQVILNIAVVTNTIPNTGVTLPFVSYGGSAILVLLAEVGIVLNISGIRTGDNAA